MHKHWLSRWHTTSVDHHGRALEGWSTTDNHRLSRVGLLRDDRHDGGGDLTGLHGDRDALGTL